MKLFTINRYFIEGDRILEIKKDSIASIKPITIGNLGKFAIIPDCGRFYTKTVYPEDVVYFPNEEGAVYLPNYFILKRDDKLARLVKKMIGLK